jgi:hypothetical protein
LENRQRFRRTPFEFSPVKDGRRVKPFGNGLTVAGWTLD